MSRELIADERDFPTAAPQRERDRNTLMNLITKPSMNDEPRDASAPSSEPPPASEGPTVEPENVSREGLGVFRALLLMAIFYLAAGSIIWFVWHACRHGHAH